MVLDKPGRKLWRKKRRKKKKGRKATPDRNAAAAPGGGGEAEAVEEESNASLAKEVCLITPPTKFRISIRLVHGGNNGSTCTLCASSKGEAVRWLTAIRSVQRNFGGDGEEAAAAPLPSTAGLGLDTSAQRVAISTVGRGGGASASGLAAVDHVVIDMGTAADDDSDDDGGDIELVEVGRRRKTRRGSESSDGGESTSGASSAGASAGGAAEGSGGSKSGSANKRQMRPPVTAQCDSHCDPRLPAV